MSGTSKKTDRSTKQFVVALAIVLVGVTVGTLFTMRFQGPRPATKPTALGHVIPPNPPPAGMTLIPGGTFQMGSNDGPADERPAHRVKLDGFWMDRTEVTNEQFQKFVQATRYITTAEKTPNLGLNLKQLGTNTAAGAFVPVRSATNITVGAASLEWRFVPGADWRHPEGPGSTIDGREKHPAVNMSWLDAVAYASWAGKRLPTEAEWEFAAAAGSSRQTPSGSDELPAPNLVNTAPAASSRSNLHGLFGMAGNVSEWCADWYGSDYYVGSPSENPRGPDQSADLAQPSIAKKVIRGSSFLTTEPTQLRITARMNRSPYVAYSDVGFRCVRSGN